ncbi:unnamed protein product [Phytophthora fragariaefolia]|uniref:Unnamed protein product n=1 Tax=Phytophthora fragariaefolia TaxID=1490495 RepID=A0A9W6U088_9STRA|nr:unnamed protein product [Phytophthora fragariaefolia]
MGRLAHATVRCRLRCIVDSSDEEEENTPPNVQREHRSRCNSVSGDSLGVESKADDASTGTQTPPWLPSNTCRNGKMNIYCNANCCPYEGKCGNGLAESDSVCLMRNMRTSSPSVVAAQDIAAGQVLGQYLGEMEHVLASARGRLRNQGYRLVMKTRPDLASKAVRMAINAEGMGGMMRFVNHSCEPVAEFREVANGRRTTVVVARTDCIRQGEEVTVDYGDDLWFVCRCHSATCRHIQDHEDP